MSEKATIVEGEKKSRYFMHGAVLWYITVVLHFIMYFASQLTVFFVCIILCVISPIDTAFRKKQKQTPFSQTN